MLPQLTWCNQYFYRRFCMGIQNCFRLLKIQYVIAIQLLRWLITFYDFIFKWTVTAGIGIHPTKAWLHSWWISKMQSGRKDTLEERYAIQLCFKHRKMSQKRMECFRLLFEHLAWIEHQILSGTRESRKARSLWGMMRGVGWVRKSIHQSLLAKGSRLGLGLLSWGFKGVQQKIPSEEVSTLQIRSVAFPQGQCTSLQLRPCQRLFD